ncbi:magnesium transporter [Agarilytica rhodophyticola]|uniref:magnesium transporter n=1 Tax=Agarilytica rhodophyticola TaxID=1737490 RepID=UPI000B34562B|nr:magnesium transporter [Agarilytica rhodophyticola]
MQQATEETKSQTHLARVQTLLGSGTLQQIAKMVNSLRPVEIARLLESSPPPSRKVVWDLVDKDVIGEVLEELPEDIQGNFIRDLDAEQLVELTEGLETDDVVDILQQLPEKVTQEVLAAMSDQDRNRVETVLAYDEDTAGGLTNTDTITIRPRFTLDVVLRYLRRHVELPPSTDALIVVNRKDQYLGLLPLAKLLTSDPNTTVREVMVTDTNAIQANLPDHEVAKLFEQNDWISAPVVDEQGKLLGRITIDDVVDVIREGADHSLMSLAGLDEEEDTFAPVMRTIPRRAIWLGINLLTAILASAVISLFQESLDKVVALAILMPVVASMGGVAGSQTLTVVIRGMAIGNIGFSNMNWLLSRELGVGLLNGCLWAIVMGGLVSLWFSDITLAFIIAAAMVINLVTAAAAGTLLPLLLKKMHIDPALAGGVTLTTVTDVIGFMAFLGLATYFYA